jgi:lipoprotein LprG
VDTYRVGAKLSKAVISSVVPGIQSDVDIKFWVEKAATRRLMRVWLQIPPAKPNEGAIMLELALSNLNVPVTVTPPG